MSAQHKHGRPSPPSRPLHCHCGAALAPSDRWVFCSCRLFADVLCIDGGASPGANRLRAGNCIVGGTPAGDQPAIASSGAAVLPDLAVGSDVHDLDLMLVCAAAIPPSSTTSNLRVASQARAQRRRDGGVSGGPSSSRRPAFCPGAAAPCIGDVPAFQEAFPTRNLPVRYSKSRGPHHLFGGVAGLDMMTALIGAITAPILPRRSATGFCTPTCAKASGRSAWI